MGGSVQNPTGGRVGFGLARGGHSLAVAVAVGGGVSKHVSAGKFNVDGTVPDGVAYSVVDVIGEAVQRCFSRSFMGINVCVA